MSKIAPIKLGTKSTQALCTGGKQSWRQQTNCDQPCHTFARGHQHEMFFSSKTNLLENTFLPFCTKQYQATGENKTKLETANIVRPTNKRAAPDQQHIILNQKLLNQEMPILMQNTRKQFQAYLRNN